MARDPIAIVFGINIKWIFLGIIYPFICWAMYQDAGSKLPWYYFLLACLLGMISGLLMITKVIEPIMQYADSKIAKLLGIKEEYRP